MKKFAQFASLEPAKSHHAKICFTLFALAWLTTARADNIGVNFEGGFFPTPMPSSDEAGVVTQKFWNNIGGGSASGVSLQGDGGGSIPVNYSGLTLTAYSSGSGTTTTTNTDGNGLLMVGYAVGETTSGVGTIGITVSNVPSALINSGYAVVVYFDFNNGGVYAVDKFTLSAAQYGTKTLYGLDKANTDFSGTFKLVPDTSTSDLGASTPDGNYLVFSGLTDTNFTLTVEGGSNGGLGANYAFINGFQIVPDSAVPVSGAPVITSANTATGLVNTAFSYTITANHSPYGFGALGLPAGLSVNSANGMISGTPTVPGTYAVTLSATNSSGVGTLALTLTIGSGIVTNAPATGTTNTLTAGSLLSISNGLVAGADGTLLATTNGGQTWGLIPVGLTNDLLAVSGIGGYEFIGGTFGLLAMSSNGGQAWTFFNLNVTNTFDSFSFLTPFWGYAVGSGGVIYFWNGSQWLAQNSGVAVNFYGVEAVDTMTAYAVGSNGTICRFNGTTWTPQNTGTTAVTFYGVNFLNDQFGYAVGSGGAIYQTTDGGTNWVALNSGVSTTLRSVWVADANTAWAVGDNGVFLQTTDGGAHWTLIPLNTGVTLYSVEFVDGRGIICGGGGAVFLFQQAGYALNAAPLVTILAPTNNATICVCSQTPITAAAYDSDGYVAKLELFLGTNELESIAGNYGTYVWTNDSALGTFTCVAKATDNLGATAFSAPVTFTFRAPATNQLVALGLVPTNRFEFCAGGLTNRVYAVQSTTNLLSSWEAWRTVTNRIGFVAVLDEGVSSNAQKFYRAGLATDLTLANGVLNPTNPAAGGTVTASITVTNTTCAAASVATGDFNVGFYWAAQPNFSDATFLTNTVVNGCPANGMVSFDQNIVIPAVPPGTYYLLFGINDDNRVPECDVDNNWWYWTLQVQ